ncbi:FG-GAP repeat domain-containing protein [Streptomyces sp. NPDC056361]|uniref:FG-GAP repeat domain-containing protein n=1 Tax=Streptomyces sp. NPDC056361 TaxID=3345795 RepID=UPI0035DF9AFC
MRSAFSGRARRVSTCTALALSAGMLLASPAVAEPAPRPAAQLPQRGHTALKLDWSALSGAAKAGTAQADAVLAPRFDVDGDGRTDLLNREWTGQLYAVPSTAVSPTDPWTGFGGSTVLKSDIVPVGDLNGNGAPEVLTVSKYGQLELFSDATATSGSRQWVGNGWTIYNKVFSPGDVNGDGKADLMGRRHNGDLYLYLATGSLTAPFGPAAKVGNGWNTYDQVVGLGDNDGDGLGDVLARTLGGQLFFYGSSGDKATPFKPRRSVGTGWGTYNQVVPVDDQNGDGKADLIARDQEGTLWRYLGLGDGRLGPRAQVSYDRAARPVDQFSGSGAIAGSGKNAVLARDKAGTLYTYYSDNNGVLGKRYEGGTGWNGYNLSFASSLGQDTDADFLKLVQGYLYGDDDTILGSGWQIYNKIAGAGDLNGDGKGDLLARDGAGNLYLYRGNGEATALHARIKVGTGWAGYNAIIGAGDYSGDGRPDVIARDGSGRLYLYRGTGDAYKPFGARTLIGTGWTYARIVAPGDLNSDGKADLLAVNGAGELWRYLGVGDGTFKPRFRIGTGFQTYNAMY